MKDFLPPWVKTPLLLFILPFAISALLEVSTPYFSIVIFLQNGVGLSLVFSLISKTFGSRPLVKSPLMLSLLLFETFFSITFFLHLLTDALFYLFLFGSLGLGFLIWKKREDWTEPIGLSDIAPGWKVLLTESVMRALMGALFLWGWPLF